jgi:hypothetical protein
MSLCFHKRRKAFMELQDGFRSGDWNIAWKQRRSIAA